MSSRQQTAVTTADVRYPVSPDQSVSEAVVLAVERASGLDAVGRDGDGVLEPLYSAVDPDALDALFAPAGEGAGPERVTFDYAGFDVTVESGEVVTVSEQ